MQPISEVIGLESHGYRLESRLSSSMAADVLLVHSIDRPEERFVIKTFAVGSLSDKQKRNALQEVSLLRKLRHKYVIAYIESWFVGAGPTTARMTVAMEYASGGDLRSPMKVMVELDCFLEESLIKLWLRQVIEALVYVHGCGVTHRDIKAMNIFLTDSWRTSLLGDFGVSAILAKESAFSQDCVGTPVYMAPELMRNEPHDGSVDMWAIGVVLYELMAFYRPFDGHSLLATCYKIINTIPSEDPLRDVGYSDATVNLCMRLLSKDPASRPSAQEVLDDMRLWDDFCMKESEALAASTCEESSKLLQTTSHDSMESLGKKPGAVGTWSSWGTAENITEEKSCHQGIRDSWDIPTIETSLPLVTPGPQFQLSPTEAAADAELREEMRRTMNDDNGIIGAARFQALLERLGGAEAASRWTAKVIQRRRDPEAIANDAKDVEERISRTATYLKRREQEESARLARDRAAELSGACDHQAVLSFHNSLRRQHGAPPLEWDDDCARKAVQVARGKDMAESKVVDAGGATMLLQSVAVSSDSLESAMQAWSAESAVYDFCASGQLEANEAGISFAHMVWQSATHVGMAEVAGRFGACYRVGATSNNDRAANVLPLRAAFAWSPQNKVEQLLAKYFRRRAMGKDSDGFHARSDRLAAPFDKLGVLGATVARELLAFQGESEEQASSGTELHAGEFCAVVQAARDATQDVDHRLLMQVASFVAADDDEDGRLSRSELKVALDVRGDVDADTAELMKLFDSDCDDKLSFTEYVMLMEALDNGEGLLDSILLPAWGPEAEEILQDIPLENEDIRLAIKVLKKHLSEGRPARVARTHGRLTVRQILSAGVFRTMIGTWNATQQRSSSKGHRREREREELKSRFRGLDGPRDGFVKFEELSGLLQRGQSESTAQLSDADLRVLFDEVDCNEKGVVNFEDFVDYIYTDSDAAPKGKNRRDRVAKSKAKAKSKRSPRSQANSRA